MNAASSKHPPREFLQAFGLGKLDDVAATKVSSHLETCADCKRQVAELSGDSFLERLWQASEAMSTPPPVETLAPPAPVQKGQTMVPSPTGVPPELLAVTQYEIIRELGAGGMGVVYLAKNKWMDRLEVLKVISTAIVHKESALARFMREIRAAAALSHDNVVKAYSALQFGTLLVFAMEYVEGDDLAKVVTTQGPLPIADACFYAWQVAQGLRHAHEKDMVHRDIKPHNLILARAGNKRGVKILDFGLAKASSEKKFDRDLTGEGKMLGTPDYAAPEQIQNAASADIRADIYSLGCTLYYFLTGSAPFNADNLYGVLHAHQTQDASSVNLLRSEVPVELGAIVAKMMAKDPAKRYQTPLEVAHALAPFFAQSGGNKSSAVPAGPAGGAASAEPVRGELAATHSEPMMPIPLATPVQHATMVANSFALPSEADVQKSAPRRTKPLLAAAMVIGMVLLGLLFWGVGGILRVKTKEGILVIEINEPNPDVYIDDEKMIVSWVNGGRKAEIGVIPGTRKVSVKKNGFTMHGEVVTLEEGGRQTISARLEKIPIPTAKSPQSGVPADASISTINKPASNPALPLVAILTGHLGPVKYLLFTPDGSRLVSASDTHREWDDGKYRQHEPGIDTGLRVWQVESGKEIRRLLLDGSLGFGLQGIGLSADGRFVAACTGSDWSVLNAPPRVHVWEIASGTRSHYFVPPGHWTMRAVGFSVDGKTLYAARNFTGLHSWSLTNGPESGTIEVADNAKGPGSPLGATFTPGCRFLVGATWKNNNSGLFAVRVWNRESKNTAIFWGHKKVVTAAAMSPDETQVLSCADDFSLRMWEMASGRQVFCLDNLDDNVVSVVFSHDGKRFLTGGADGVVRLRDAATGKQLAQFTGHTAKVNCVSFAPTGGLVASGSDDKTIRLWRLPGSSVDNEASEKLNSEVEKEPAVNVFAPLFNTKDLTGWHKSGNPAHTWQVIDGTIVGSGPPTASCLFTRQVFRDFHLRIETTMAEGPNGYIQFRQSAAGWYHIVIDGTEDKVRQTGNLGFATMGLTPGTPLADAKPAVNLRPDQWFTLEIIAIGRTIRVLVQGKQVVTYEDPEDRFASGFINLVCRGNSKVRFRKIEIKELP